MDNLAILEPTFVNIGDKTQKRTNKEINRKKFNELIENIKDSLPDSDHDESNLQ